MKHRIWQDTDGVVKVTTFVTDDPEKRKDAIGKLFKDKHINENAKFFDCEDLSELPSYGLFHEAWMIVNGKVEIDMKKARILKMKDIRKERDALLLESDISVFKQMDGIASSINLTTYRQALRDFPTTVDLSVIEDPIMLKDFKPIFPIKE